MCANLWEGGTVNRYRLIWLGLYFAAALFTLWQVPAMDHHWPVLIGLFPGLLALPLGPLVAIACSAVLFEVFRFIGAPLGIAPDTGVLRPLWAQAVLVLAVVTVTGWSGYLQWFVWLPRLLRRNAREKSGQGAG